MLDTYKKPRSWRGSIASDVDHSAHGGHGMGTKGLKPKPVSLISHLKVLQSPYEGFVGEPTIDCHQFLIVDCCEVLSVSESLSVHCCTR